MPPTFQTISSFLFLCNSSFYVAQFFWKLTSASKCLTNVEIHFWPFLTPLPSLLSILVAQTHFQSFETHIHQYLYFLPTVCGILLHLRDWRSNIWIQFNLNLNILLIERCRESSWEMTNPLWMSAMKADSLIDFLSPLTLPSSSTSSPHYLLVSEKTELWFNVRSHATNRDAVRHSAVRWVLTVCKDDICVPLKWNHWSILSSSLLCFPFLPHLTPFRQHRDDDLFTFTSLNSEGAASDIL